MKSSGMPVINPLTLFASPLERSGFRYMTKGSVAATLYGEPRLTNDVDIVADIASNQVAQLHQLFPEPSFYVPPAEVILDELARRNRGHIHLIHIESGLKADIYIVGNDPLHEWGMTRSKRIRVGDFDVSVAPPEYVIVRKLEFYREGGSQKHIRDIQSMLGRSGDHIDRDAIRQLVAMRGLEPVWSELRL